jgi:hypothetical protein
MTVFEQLELFAFHGALGSVPFGKGMMVCSVCRGRGTEHDNYWTWNGRQYRTHDRCHAEAQQRPEYMDHHAAWLEHQDRLNTAHAKRRAGVWTPEECMAACAESTLIWKNQREAAA